MNQTGNPDNTEQAGVSERRAKFRKRILGHKRMKEVRERVLKALDPEDPSKVIAVCGPTGVGKTTLLNSLARTLRNQYKTDEPGSMPVVEVLCPASPVLGYDFHRVHWSVTLQALDDTLIRYHCDPQEAAKRRRAGMKRTSSRRLASGQELLLAAQQYVKHRKTRVLMYDEAQHMASVRGSKQAHQNMDFIKSFGNATGVKQILFGTEDMLEMLRGNSQLTKRTEEIFFDAYDYDSAADRKAFDAIFGQLFGQLPINDPEPLEECFDEAFIGSAGCVGILKEWLSRALGLALDRGSETVKLSDLRESAIPDARLRVIAEGIRRFRDFTNEQPPKDEIRHLLGLPVSPPEKSKPKNKQQPGVRNAHRDPLDQVA